MSSSNLLPDFRRRFRLAFALLAGLAAAGLGTRGVADVRVSGYFSDNLVIQSGMPFAIWGRSDEGETVEIEVSWLERRQTAVRAADGVWRASFPAPAAPGPHTITLRGKNTVAIRNVLCGDVWLCAGQSNMAMPLAYQDKNNRGVLDFEAELRDAQHPQLRYFLVSREKNASSSSDLLDVQGEWKICTPETAGGFSGVAYYFGERLQAALKRPVGLIDNSWGGTYIQSWMSPPVLASDPDFAAHLAWAKRGLDELPAEQARYREKLQQWEQSGAKPAEKPAAPYWAPGHRNIPSGLYHARVAPLFPVSLKGVLWYQGEANAGQAWLYQRLLPAMIRDWRAGWQRADLPFLLVQLPSIGAPGEASKGCGSSAWAELREAQALAAKTVPGTHLVVSLDAGEDHIHPRNKRPVGERLALTALAEVYGWKLTPSGPRYAGMRVDGGKVVVGFDRSDAGLRTTDGAAVRGFALASADRKFFPATAEIVGHTVVVQSGQVPVPVAVRYAWADCPDCNVTNAERLPAAPFRSDEWPGSTFGRKSP